MISKVDFEGCWRIDLWPPKVALAFREPGVWLLGGVTVFRALIASIGVCRKGSRASRRGYSS